MKKELVIAARFDTSDFDKSVDSMQKKLREMYSPADQVRQQMMTSQKLQQAGYGSMAGAPDSASYQRTLADNKRVLDRNIREEKTNLEEKAKKLIQQQDIQKKISEQYQIAVKGGKEELEIKNKLLEAQKELNKAQKEYGDSHVKVNALLNERQRLESPGMAPPGSRLPPGGGKGDGGGLGGQSLAAILKGVSGVLASLATGAAAYNRYAAIPSQVSTSMGGAIQNTIGSPLQDLASGNTVKLSAFLSERQRAMEMAVKRTQDTALTGHLTSFNALAGDVTGAASKLLPRMGPMGKIAGMLGIPGMLGGASERYQSGYEAERMGSQGQNFADLMKAEEEKNPLKRLAAEGLQSTYRQDLMTQRQLGLSDQGYWGTGGFQERANIAGFNPDLAAGMSSQIMAAGGSTRGGQQNNILGLQAQRGFDMTNAGTVLGRISGGAGGSQATDAIFKKLLEESIKAGLDKSEFREEQRKFADVTSSVLASSGVRTAEDAEKVLQGFTRFLGKDSTMKELEGAKSAYEEQQAFSAETGGRGGALQFASMMKNPVLSKLSASGMGGLMQMPEKDLTATNPFVVAMASEAGVSPQDIVKNAMEEKRNAGLSYFGLSSKKMSALQEYMAKNGEDVGTLTKDQIDAMPDELRRSYLAATEATIYRGEYGGPQKQAADIRGLISGKYQPQISAEEYGPGSRVEGGLEAPTGRAADEVVRSTGVVAQEMLKNFREFKDAVTPANDALSEATKRFLLFAAALNLIPDAQKPAAMDYMNKAQAAKDASKNQQQGSKPSK
jgi:hypothetical protein